MSFGESKSSFVHLMIHGLKCVKVYSNSVLFLCLENANVSAEIKEEAHSEDGEFEGIFLF